MSAALPSEMKCEKPTPRGCAQSRSAVVSAPDCATKARCPGIAPVCAKLALRPMPGTSNPMQLGPKIRSRWRPAARSMALASVPPSGARCSSPELITIAAREPRDPRAATTPGMVAAGVQITARSGACGRSSTLRYALNPATLSCRRFTGQTGPWNPPCKRLLITVAPTLCGLSEAPIRATERGLKRYSRFRLLTSVLLPGWHPRPKGTISLWQGPFRSHRHVPQPDAICELAPLCGNYVCRREHRLRHHLCRREASRPAFLRLSSPLLEY